MYHENVLRGGKFITEPNRGSRFKIPILGPRPVSAQDGPVQMPAVQTETVSILKNKKESANTNCRYWLVRSLQTGMTGIYQLAPHPNPNKISSVNKTILIQMRSVWSLNLVGGPTNMAYGHINTV